MREDGAKKRKGHRKKKSKFGYYLYAVVVLMLTIANVTIGALLLTYVQQIQVTGNKISRQSDIISWIQEDPLTANSLYTLWKFRSSRSKIKMPIYLEGVDVSLSAPWKVKVKVREKQMIGCVLSEGSYVYFDAEGLVLKKSSEYEEGIPVIEGIKVSNTELFTVLKVDNQKVFSYVVDIADGIEGNHLSPEQIVWEDDSMNLYFGDVCVKLGKSNFDIKLNEVRPILKKLKGESGTLQMEHYTTDNASISFEKNT